jgi:hypothetical protein
MDMSPEQLRAMMNGYDDQTIAQMGQHDGMQDGMHDGMDGMHDSWQDGMHDGMDGMHNGMHDGKNSKDDDMFEKLAPFLTAKLNMTEEELRAF